MYLWLWAVQTVILSIKRTRTRITCARPLFCCLSEQGRKNERGEIVMGKQLGICDIAYYAERMTVFEAPRVVKDQNEKLHKVPQASHYVVRKLQAEKVISYRKGTEKLDKVIEVVPIKSISSVAKF